jgi:hypothetical protein
MIPVVPVVLLQQSICALLSLPAPLPLLLSPPPLLPQGAALILPCCVGARGVFLRGRLFSLSFSCSGAVSAAIRSSGSLRNLSPMTLSSVLAFSTLVLSLYFLSAAQNSLILIPL